MTENASCRNPLRAPGSLQLGNWAQETSDRGGQDKNRKVRTVGWVRNSAKSGLLANIAKRLSQLALFENALSALNF